MLAIANPQGIKSNHKWNFDVLESHKATDAFEIIPMNTDTKVKIYSLPVLRMNLENTFNVSRLLILVATTYHPANKLPQEMEI